MLINAGYYLLAVICIISGVMFVAKRIPPRNRTTTGVILMTVGIVLLAVLILPVPTWH